MESERIEMTKMTSSKKEDPPIELFESKGTNSTKIGNLSCYYPDPRTGDYRIVIGPSYQLYIIITILIMLLNIVFHIHYDPYLNHKVIIGSIGLYLLSLILSIKVFLTNPGIPSVSLNKKQDDNEYIICEECNLSSERKKFVLHCKSCKCCIEDFENHSAFFGKCIGKGNFWSYTIFYVTQLLVFIFMICVKALKVSE